MFFSAAVMGTNWVSVSARNADLSSFHMPLVDSDISDSAKFALVNSNKFYRFSRFSSSKEVFIAL
jgi:hypothetical protein